MPTLIDERRALMALLLRPGAMRWAGLRSELEEHVSAIDVLEREPDRTELLSVADARIEAWSRLPGEFFTYLDEGYPKQLHDVWDFPPFVFVRGDLDPLLHGTVDRGVCIVGSRGAAPASIVAAELIAGGLIDDGVTIVSGLADGVDSAAHRTALRAGARTVGIIGTGIDRYYPDSSRPMQQAMEQGAGMVLSQFLPGAAPSKISFPMRNGVMSAYGQATVIVEATEASGTRHQAKQAVAHGRALILAEPVARRTTWGRKLAASPAHDVRVATSPEHALELARAVLAYEPLRVSSDELAPF